MYPSTSSGPSARQVAADIEEVDSVVPQEVGALRNVSSAGGSGHIRSLADLRRELLELREYSPSATGKPQCPRVPKSLVPSDAKGSDDHHYEPKVVSFGPYHHGNPTLVRGEKIKLILAAHFFQELAKSTVIEWEEFYNIISGSISKLKGCYDRESTVKYSDEEFCVMMLVDGCALLCYILCVCIGGDLEVYNIRYQDLSRLHRDALLLENQLPYEFLRDDLMSLMPERSNDDWNLKFQQFFGLTDEPFIQESFDIEKEAYLFLQKMKNFYCGRFLAIVQIFNLNRNANPDVESGRNPDEEADVESGSNPVADVESGSNPVADVKSRRQKMKNFCCGRFLAIVQIFSLNRNANPDVESGRNPDEEADVESGSNPVADVESGSNPVADVQSGSNPVADVQSRRETIPHLLHLYRTFLLGDKLSSPRDWKDEFGGPGAVGVAKEQVRTSFRNVKELMDAGIRIKRSPTRHLRDISFRSNGITACLRIPPITIDNSTKTMFLNLIAYEMSSGVDHDFISYLRFLDSLIDHADDVEELQSAGVLRNNLGTHEVVAEFFNTVSANLDSNSRYEDVRIRIRKHLVSNYNSKLKMWMTQCLRTYFGSPWTIIAWVGAALALFFTAVQTYFSAFSH